MDRFPYSPPPCCRVGGVGKQRNLIGRMFNDLMFKCFTSLSHVPNAITWMTWHDMDLTRLRCLVCLLCRKSWTQNRSKVPKRSFEFSNSSLGCFTFHFKSLKDGNLVSEFQICQHPDFADQSNQLKSRFPQLLFTEFFGAISCINAWNISSHMNQESIIHVV